LPASGDCRVRLINTDTTRVMQIGVEGAEAAIVAIDGMAVRPFPLTIWSMGPAMRIDIVLRAPAEGRIARLVDQSPPGRVALAHFAGRGAPRRSAAFDPAPLHAPRIAEPDTKAAERLSFVFQASESGRFIASADTAPGATVGALCLSQKLSWTINGRRWPDRDRARLPPPLAVLKRGSVMSAPAANPARMSSSARPSTVSPVPGLQKHPVRREMRSSPPSSSIRR
jgi:FtsP/CotA-like multicopper oxidase with cupredoxin domain